jgi:hypothetical protein
MKYFDKTYLPAFTLEQFNRFHKRCRDQTAASKPVVPERFPHDGDRTARPSQAEMAMARQYGFSEQFWRMIAEFAYQESFEEQDLCPKYFEEKYYPEFSFNDFKHFYKIWKSKQPPKVEPTAQQTPAEVARGPHEDQAKQTNESFMRDFAEAVRAELAKDEDDDEE